MDETATHGPTFDVEGEYERLIKNNQELHSKGFISPTAARKAAEKIRQWRRSNLYLQLGTG